MRGNLKAEIEKLDGAVSALEAAASGQLLTRARVLVRRLAVYTCGECYGAYQVKPDGLRCSNCGKLIPVKWPDGRTPTGEELDRLMELALKDLPADDHHDR